MSHKGERQRGELSSPGEENAIEDSTSKVIAQGETRTYMLSLKLENGFVQFYFKQRPAKPDWCNDGPLHVRIPQDCKIRLLLDPDLRWSFRHDFKHEGDYIGARKKLNDAVTLGGLTPEQQDCYHNLLHVSDREVQFDAWFLPAGTVYHPFNIYIDLDAIQNPRAKELLNPLAIRVDPDIKNPGDDPHQYLKYMLRR